MCLQGAGGGIGRERELGEWGLIGPGRLTQSFCESGKVLTPEGGASLSDVRITECD